MLSNCVLLTSLTLGGKETGCVRYAEGQGRASSHYDAAILLEISLAVAVEQLE